MTNLVCDRVPIWGLLSLGGLQGLEIPPPTFYLLANDLEGSPGIPATKAEAPGMPKEVQIENLSSSRLSA